MGLVSNGDRASVWMEKVQAWTVVVAAHSVDVLTATGAQRWRGGGPVLLLLLLLLMGPRPLGPGAAGKWLRVPPP